MKKSDTSFGESGINREKFPKPNEIKNGLDALTDFDEGEATIEGLGVAHILDEGGES